jgi:hypothetical protein
MRKAESRIDRGFARLFGRSPQVSLQAGELAMKMMKEMDGRKRAIHGREYVPNFYAVYLCPADRARFKDTEDALVRRLEGQLLQHARTSGYNVMSAPEVSIITDADLKVGQFGLRAEMRDPVSGRVLDSSVPLPKEPLSAAAEEEAHARPERMPVASAEALPHASDARRRRLEARQQAAAGPAVVLRQNGRSEEFRQEHVVLGRARDADFRVQDPNVSRRHAMIYWDQGRVFLKDLGSTNGTLLNGRPVSSGVVSSGDIITIGGTHVVVETGE